MRASIEMCSFSLICSDPRMVCKNYPCTFAINGFFVFSLNLDDDILEPGVVSSSAGFFCITGRIH